MIEVWGRPIGGNASGIAWGLAFWQQPGGSNQVDGYRFRQDVATSGGGTNIYRYSNGNRTVIASGPSSFTGAPNGGLFLFRIFSTGLMEAYSSQDFGVTWTLKASVTDLTYTGTFYLGLGINDNSVSQILAWRTVGGGNVLKHRTRIIRWVSN